MDRTILHIDFDSFFASVEQQYNPSLRDKPIGVTAQNGRTCIIASSREAKKLGIKTGSRTWEAKKLCPSIILVSADFIKYWQISKKFIAICNNYSPVVEVFSIDELFMDVTHCHHLFGGVDSLILKIKNQIRKEIGEYITASFGISYNKLLAKLASGLNKPDGIYSIQQKSLDNVYSRAKLTDVCGIGERVKVRLNKIGIRTLLELRKSSIELLVKEFGKVEGQFLKNIGLAIDDSPIIPYTQAPEVKSVGRNYCLPKNEYNRTVVLQNIYELCEEVGIKLRRLGKKAKTVTVALRGNIDIHGQKTSMYYIDSGKDIFHACLAILRALRLTLRVNESREVDSGQTRMTFSTLRPRSGRAGSNSISCYIRQISIGVSSLVDKHSAPLSFFEDPRKEKLLSVIDSINDRFGDHTIRNGFLLYADKLTTVPNGYMADKYERVKLARSV